MALQVAPQLSFQLNNPQAADTVYISSDPADNQLTLVVGSSVEASFTAATPVAIDQAGAATGSLLYLDLTPLGLTATEFEAIAVATPGWASGTFTDSGGERYLCLAPTGPASITPPNTFALAISNFTMANKPAASTSQLSVIYFRVTGITTGSNPYVSNLAVAVQYPPDDQDQDLHQAIQASVLPGAVVNSIAGYPAIQNQLTLRFGPASGSSPQVMAGAATAFVLTFVYAPEGDDGFGALLTPAQASTLHVAAGTGATSWTITSDLDQQSPSWSLVPPSGSGQPILGPGQVPIEFAITNLVTQFQPGPTLMLACYSGVPGYQSGSYSILLEKFPHVSIADFTVSPPRSQLVNGTAEVTLRWTVANATSLVLGPPQQDVTALNQFSTKIKETTRFTLTAQGESPLNVDNTAIQHVTAQVVPVIESFAASPQAIYQGDFPCNVALDWDVDANGSVDLISSLNPLDPTTYPNGKINTSRFISKPQMLTLVPATSTGGGSGGTPPNRGRSLIITAFEVEGSADWNTSADSAHVAAPPNMSCIAVTSPKTSQVNLLSTYYRENHCPQPYASASVSPAPTGLAFSPDGSTLYVANGVGGTVNVIGVTSAGGFPPYTLTPLSEVPVVLPSWGVAVGPDGRAWVTLDNGSSNGYLAMIEQVSGTYTFTKYGVGLNPRGVVLTPDGSTLYVANRGSNSVSVFSVTGEVPSPGPPLTNVTAPNGLAITPDGSTLLVACVGNAIVAIPVQSPGAARTFDLPGEPVGIAVFPGGQYVVATCAGANTVVTLNYQTGAIIASISLTQAPLGVAVTSDNGLALIGYPESLYSPPGQGSLGVLYFAGYVAQRPWILPSCSSLVSCVAVTPTMDMVVAWYGAQIAEEPGLNVYTPGNQVMSQVLTDTAIADVAISPVDADDALYIALQGQPTVAVYQTSCLLDANVQPIATITLPAEGGSNTRRPVLLSLSNDGTRLFVLTVDDGGQYSVVVFDVAPATKSFQQLADVPVFTAYSVFTSNTPLPAVLAAAADGSAAYVIDADTNTLYNVQESGGTYQLAQSFLNLGGGLATGMAILPDGSRAYVISQPATTDETSYFCVVDLAAWTPQTVSIPDTIANTGPRSIAVTPDGSKLLVLDEGLCCVRVLDAGSLRLIQYAFGGLSSPLGIAVSRDGSQAFFTNGYREIVGMMLVQALG